MECSGSVEVVDVGVCGSVLVKRLPEEAGRQG